MAEMTTLTAAIYRKYKTRPPGDQYKSVSPIITSRFETFFDELDNVGPVRFSLSPTLKDDSNVK